MMYVRARAALVGLLLLAAAPAASQTIPGWESKQFTFEQLDADRVRLVREVEIHGTGANEGQQIFADELIWNLTTGEFEAVGNVLVVSPSSRVAAERVVFNTKTRRGTFYTAAGSASLGERAVEDRSMFGTLEPDVYFRGEVIEKIGEDRYRITRGAFTTCVQPTPRWEIVSGSATIDLEDYAILRHAVLRVKDVPLFYLPVLYYPIQSDDRATGFLLPTYGTSSFRGQSLSNAFFWAIDRSQDLTLMHDWFTRAGQGAGAEYRYVLAPGSEGQIRGYYLKQKASAFEGGALPAETSYEIRGGVAQALPGGLRARLNLDYFSSLTTQQLYNTDIYNASRRQRTIAGSVGGAWGGLSVTGAVQRSELFYSLSESIVNGFAPSLTANLSSRRLGALPVYFSLQSDASRVLYLNRRGEVVDDRSLFRIDATPTVRAALSTLPFLSINASAAYRHSYYSESLVDGVQAPVPLTRQYFDLRTDIIGPVLARVFTPGTALADRLKHVIEPSVSFQRITQFENAGRVPSTGSSYDAVLGGVTRIQYGLTNRVLVRPRSRAEGAPSGAPRELLSVAVNQTYYTTPDAARYDTTYVSSYNEPRDSSFSPVAVVVRSAPTSVSAATLRLEYDPADGVLKTLSVNGESRYRAAETAIGWSTRRYANSPVRQNALSTRTTVNLLSGRTGGTYTMDWDIANGYVIQQRWIGFYNAQCCGIALEYQRFKFPGAIAGIPQDRRFNISFTLAGIGTFSNFFGAFGGGR
jgi:LPS-assembly protein